MNLPLSMPDSCQLQFAFGLQIMASFDADSGTYQHFRMPHRALCVNRFASRLLSVLLQWTVTCGQPLGNAFYNPAVGGGPSALEVCGSMSSNAPLPAQQFGISFSGGWVGDGSQPGACASSVTVSSGDA